MVLSCFTLLAESLPTKYSDALNAIAGLLRQLPLRMKCDFLKGSPAAEFDNFCSSAIGRTYAGERNLQAILRHTRGKV